VFDNIRPYLVDSVDIERADVQINTSTIKDRRVAKYDVIASAVPTWLEPGATQYIYGDQLGQTPVRSSTAYFIGGTDVREGDRLKDLKTGKYHLVKDVADYTNQGMHVVCQVVEKAYAMGQA
jgi:hypothetical protein